MDRRFPSKRRLELHYIVMQAAFWLMFAAICSYQAALLQERGFTSGETGIIMAVRCLSGIIFQPILGGWADRHPEVPLKYIVSLCLASGLAASTVYWLHPMGMGGTLVIFIILGGFEITCYPLMDSMAVQYINAGVPIRYSLGRGIGSMAYALCALGMGYQVQALGVETTLVTHGVMVVLCIAAVLTYPTFHAPPLRRDGTQPAPHSVLALLTANPPFTVMLLAVLLAITGVLPLGNFMVNIINSRGGDAADLGLGLFLMAAFELPAAFLFQKLSRRYPSGKIMAFAVAATAAKGVVLLCTSSFAGVLAAQPFQMLGYGLFTPTSVYFVNDSVPAEDRVRGQTIMMVASNGLGGVLGNALAGAALDAGGVGAMLWVCTLCCLAGGGVALISMALKRRERARSARQAP